MPEVLRRLNFIFFDHRSPHTNTDHLLKPCRPISAGSGTHRISAKQRTSGSLLANLPCNYYDARRRWRKLNAGSLHARPTRQRRLMGNPKRSWPTAGEKQRDGCANVRQPAWRLGSARLAGSLAVLAYWQRGVAIVAATTWPNSSVSVAGEMLAAATWYRQWSCFRLGTTVSEDDRRPCRSHQRYYPRGARVRFSNSSPHRTRPRQP